MQEGDINITPADNLPPIQDPPTPEELKEMSEGRRDVLADQREKVAFMAAQNAAALQVILTMEVQKYVDPETGECDFDIGTTAIERMKNLSLAASAAGSLLKP